MHNPADIQSFNDTGKLNTIVPIKQFVSRREQYDTMESDIFAKRINQLNKPQKEINLDNHLAKFTVQANNIEEERQRKIKEDRDLEKKIQEERRKLALNTLVRTKAFQYDWTSQNEAVHAQAMQRKFEREQKEQDFKQMSATKARYRAIDQEQQERRDVLEGIDDFEVNADKLGIELEHSPDKKKKAKEPSLHMSMSPMLLKSMDKPLQLDAGRKERDKR